MKPNRHEVRINRVCKQDGDNRRRAGRGIKEVQILAQRWEGYLSGIRRRQSEPTDRIETVEDKVDP